MTADPYAWPRITLDHGWDDYAGRLAAAEAKLAAVQTLIDTHTQKDGRVPVCQLRTAIGGPR